MAKTKTRDILVYTNPATIIGAIFVGIGVVLAIVFYGLFDKTGRTFGKTGKILNEVKEEFLE